MFCKKREGICVERGTSNLLFGGEDRQLHRLHYLGIMTSIRTQTPDDNNNYNDYTYHITTKINTFRCVRSLSVSPMCLMSASLMYLHQDHETLQNIYSTLNKNSNLLAYCFLAQCPGLDKASCVIHKLLPYVLPMTTQFLVKLHDFFDIDNSAQCFPARTYIKKISPYHKT